MIVDRKSLLALLENAVQVARPHAPIPILGTVRLTSTDGRLEATATDLATTLMASVPCDGALVPICVPARLLSRIVAACDGDSVMIADDSGALTLRAGRADFRLLCMSAADFPTAQDEVGDLVGDGQVAINAIRAAARVVSIVRSDADRAFATGVWVAVSPLGFDVLALDGHRYVRIGHGDPGVAHVCVPRRAIRLAVSLVDAGTPAVLRRGPTTRVIEAGEARISTRLIDADLPDLAPEHITPPRAIDATICDREALLAAVERIAGEHVSLSGRPEGVVVTCDENDVVAREIVDATVAAFATGLTARYVRDALMALSSETIALTIGTDAPVRIDGANGEVAVIAALRHAGPETTPECVCEWPDNCDGDGSRRCKDDSECICPCGGNSDCPGCEACA